MPRLNRRTLITHLGALCALGAAAASRAQTYPSKPIRLVVPFAPGTGSDLIARMVAPRLSELLGQNVIVDNRPGAGGGVGAEAVARSAPDGYTLLFATIAQFVIAPALHGEKLRYRPDADFVALGTVARSPMLVLASAAEGTPRTIEQLEQRLKSGKQAFFSSAGTGSFGHLMGTLLVNRLGASATHVPYKGSAQSLADVSTGQVLFTIDSPAAAAPMIQSNNIRALAITGSRRSPSMRDVPTLDETGIKDMNINAWFGIFGPAGLPPAITQRLRAEISRVVAEEQLHQRLGPMNLEPYMATPEQFERMAKDELSFWKKFVSDAGITVD